MKIKVLTNLKNLVKITIQKGVAGKRLALLLSFRNSRTFGLGGYFFLFI